ncbi:hypothetical protein GGTG_01818 [Gaeumannomyces tritici R3-111a-1]|uniref:Uncharacterized protein n=1 Tax=Gaeumannomyces tritici (strain R3-111a-1) TaxID=644352 RepID=J3NKM7_GAET3|nr:hypothetical protein GGTG_01818 [Gaeumannomyces tritici R3-111a-1]EJT81844.1 hypothetical protein GGTG_01818 [Gaeumannomyces tritici R3-111a-1]
MGPTAYPTCPYQTCPKMTFPQGEIARPQQREVAPKFEWNPTQSSGKEQRNSAAALPGQQGGGPARPGRATVRG